MPLQYPAGGMGTQVNDFKSVAVNNCVFTQGTFTTTDEAADVVIPAGTVLARLTTTGAYTAYVDGGANGAGIPKAVLHTPIVSPGTATSLPFGCIVAGEVDAAQLLVKGETVGVLTPAEVESLRDFGIEPTTVTNQSRLDNV